MLTSLASFSAEVGGKIAIVYAGTLGLSKGSADVRGDSLSQKRRYLGRPRALFCAYDSTGRVLREGEELGRRRLSRGTLYSPRRRFALANHPPAAVLASCFACGALGASSVCLA